MECLHPNCLMGEGAHDWETVVEDPRLRARARDRSPLVAYLSGLGAPGSGTKPVSLPTINTALLSRLMQLCPCLYSQIDTRCTPAGVVHLCEMTVGGRITSANVFEAFEVQHPRKGPKFLYAPTQPCTDGGGVMERLCSEVLNNEQIPAMELGIDGWPVWKMPGHISLNSGQMRSVKAFGDILIPCAPANVIISVKSEAARERLLYSANMIEGVGFGFFDRASEFWTEARMNLFKRMGFTAIYLPNATHTELMTHLAKENKERFAVNVNGNALYRPLSEFGRDMRRIVGKTSLVL